jgi:hypothetical protein
MKEKLVVRDAMYASLEMSRSLAVENTGMRGCGVAELKDGDGKHKLVVPFVNLITTVGDRYYADRGSLTTPQLTPAYMALGTSTIQPGKSTNAGIVTAGGLTPGYKAFYGTTPDTIVNPAGADQGYYVQYVTQWAAGEATGNLGEVVITSATSTWAAATCISRAVFGTVIPKGDSDTLTITWNHLFYGA